MYFSIFNSITNIIPVLEEVSLLKVSLLLAARTDLSSITSEFISLYFAEKNYTPEQKLNLYPAIIKMFSKNIDVDNIVMSLETYIKLHKTKHKNKRNLIVYQMAINSIKAMENYIKACVEGTLQQYDFDLLKVFLSEDKNSIFKYYNGVIDFREPNQVRRVVEFFSTAVYSINMLPVLPDIRSLDNVNLIDVNNCISLPNNDSAIDVIELPIFKLQSPCMLDAGQIKQIRSELNENISAFYKNYIEFNDRTCTKAFDESITKPVFDFYNDNADLLSEINKTLDENIFLKQIPINIKGSLGFTVSANFTSISNLLRIYSLFNIFPENVIKYIEEYLIKYSSLNCNTNFITIRLNKND